MNEANQFGFFFYAGGRTHTHTHTLSFSASNNLQINNGRASIFPLSAGPESMPSQHTTGEI